MLFFQVKTKFGSKQNEITIVIVPFWDHRYILEADRRQEHMYNSTMRHAYLSFPRNIYLLFLAQIIGGISASVVPLLGGLIGADIAPTPSLVTFPATSMFIGIAVGTIPAALLMKKIGRRNGFLLSALLASLAALVAAFSVSQQMFYLLCLSCFFMGFHGAFVQQYRFAGGESVAKHTAGKAVGFILFAGIIAGILGPEIAKLTQNTFTLPGFTSSFILLSLLFAVSGAFLFFLRDTHALEEKIHVKERPLKHIVTDPRFYVAVLAAATSYSVMSLIMGAVPIHLHMMPAYTFDNIVFLSQSHVVGMYLPSLFTGVLMQRLGVYRTFLLGLGAFCLSIFLAVHADSLIYYWGVSVLIGIGWNFLFIPATVLLSQTHTHLERFKAQGINDFIVFVSQVVSSFMIGSLLLTGGWNNLNLLALPLIILTIIIFTANRKRLNKS